MIERLVELLPGSQTGRSSNSAQKPLLTGQDVRAITGPLEKLILEYPAAALASAFVIGVTLAWWIKRK